MTRASATATPYSHAAGWASRHHGTTLARKVPAGTETANTPATCHHRARRRRRSGAAPQNASPIAARTAASAST